MTIGARHDAGKRGESRRDAALEAHEREKHYLILRVRHALIRRLLTHYSATLDDVIESIELPTGVDRRCLGAVGQGLAKAGVITASGFVRSTRPTRNASPVQQWRLISSELAMEWLRDNPLPTASGCQQSLF